MITITIYKMALIICFYLRKRKKKGTMYLKQHFYPKKKIEIEPFELLLHIS